MVHFEFDQRSQVINCLMKDKVVADDLTKFIKSMVIADDLPQHLRMLINMLDCELILMTDQLQGIVEANNCLLQKYTTVRHAIVIDKPVSTALAMFYKKLSLQKNYNFQIFSTLTAAQRWILGNHGC